MSRKAFKRGPATRGLAVILCLIMAMPMFAVAPAMAQVGTTTVTPDVPMELPVEIEIEIPFAASLKQAPLWKELIQLLQFPYANIQDPQFPLDPNARITTAPIVRRPGFGATMPPLKIWSPGYNFLTAQPLRLRTSDGEVSWDQPGPLYDNDEPVPVDAFNAPLELRTPIGHLVACPDNPPYQSVPVPAGFCNGKPNGSLVVFNTSGSTVIPPDGTVVAVSAFVGGALQELDGTSTTDTVAVAAPLEIPINEEDFFVNRAMAEVLGKALFWDMQVGSDGVQACGSCHFHAGADNRTRNQLNPDHLGGDNTLQVRGPNQPVQPGDFPFHKLFDVNTSGEATNCGFPGLPACTGNVISDANDVMSSMGVIFRTFVDIPTPGPGAFGPPVNGVSPLLPDIGVANPDPLGAVFQGLRRVEPRNTPTFHGAAFNFDNFWDGRARFHFNGGSVFGPSDPFFHVYIDDGGVLEGASNGHFRPDLFEEDPEVAEQPVRIKFSSLASQAVGPPLSNFEMSFDGRNWAKIGKKLLQPGVVPLANQLVSTTDSVLGPFSNQNTTPGMPGLNISYPELIQLAFRADLWQNVSQHLNGAAALCNSAVNGVLDPPGCDPFDGYVLTIAGGAADATNTSQFTQMEANFSLFFGLAVQAYEELTIPDDSPFDRFMDANPLAANAIGQPGEQGVLFPTLVPGLVGGSVTLVPGFGQEELLGLDIFAGGNLTAALPPGPVGVPGGPGNRNPSYIINGANGPVTIATGSNPFSRSARCGLCHLGPEQTDHSINIAHGLLKGDAEFEFPTPPFVPDPGAPNCIFADCLLPAPEAAGVLRTVPGLILAEEIEGSAQDQVEVEPRNFATFDNPLTPWDDRVVAQPGFFAFGDQGIYNIGVRPINDDIGRGGDDLFGMPLSLSALALKNIAGVAFEPCDFPTDSCVMANVDPLDLGTVYEETGEGLFFPGSTHTLQSINPGFEKDPAVPLLPLYLAHWAPGLPAGELHPQIDEMAFAPNTITPPNGGPALEFGEAMFGADIHCALYDPATFGAGPPNFGWGPPASTDNVCPNNQSGVAGNYDVVLHGTWPNANRVLRNGAFKAPALRNVELTGPYFHTGSFLTLRQVVDFYMRGGDFPVANAEARDPHMLEIEEQAFGFGRTRGADLGAVNVSINTSTGALCTPGTPGCITYNGNLADALPDTDFQYDVMPDTDHAITPEYLTAEDAKVALVRFLLSLTDERVKFERAPFDRPEIFVPLNGAAPDNTGGRAQLAALSATPCAPGSIGNCFMHIPAVGAGGNPTPLPNFLNIASVPSPGNDHFDSVTVTQTFSISGTVRGPNTLRGAGAPLSGVTITLSGDASATTLTDANGNYTLIVPNGNYIVTPSRSGLSFTPVSRAVIVNGANVTGQDFTGAAGSTATAFSISGRVTAGTSRLGTAVPGVLITLSGAASGTTFTNALGNYIFTGLADGSYTVTPSQPGFTFTPPSRAVTISGASVVGQNFTRN
jgi:cytochrome c peroxidase